VARQMPLLFHSQSLQHSQVSLGHGRCGGQCSMVYQAYSIWLRHVILPWTAPGYLGPLLLRYLPKQTNSFMISSEGNRLFVLMD
jgi:hypothetical protein